MKSEQRRMNEGGKDEEKMKNKKVEKMSGGGKWQISILDGATFPRYTFSGTPRQTLAKRFAIRIAH